MTCQIKVQLRGVTKPPVWRRLLVPAECTFHHFHYIIQQSFGWCNAHLYQFMEKPYSGEWSIKELLDGIDDGDFLAGFGRSIRYMDSGTLTLEKFLEENPLKKFVYIYDFGDDWFHDITFEDETEEILLYPRCIAGKGTCPPEDCGGIWGYEYIKQVFQEAPKSREANRYRKWLGLEKGEVFDPKKFDLNRTNELIVSLMNAIRKNMQDR